MYTGMQALSAYFTEVAGRSLGSYLPWSPLTGIGPASDFAAWHPAFAIDAADDPRLDT